MCALYESHAPHTSLFSRSAGNACACACVLPWLRDGACCLLPSLPERKWGFPNLKQRCQAPPCLPPLLLPAFNPPAGTRLVGMPVPNGALDKRGQLILSHRFLCLTSLWRASSGRETKTAVRVSVSSVCVPSHCHYGL